MTEEEFTTAWIAAVMKKNQDKMLTLGHKAIKQFGQDAADQLARDCYAGIVEADPETGEWLNSWFNFNRRYR